jgi:hypothetical protein
VFNQFGDTLFHQTIALLPAGAEPSGGFAFHSLLSHPESSRAPSPLCEGAFSFRVKVRYLVGKVLIVMAQVGSQSQRPRRVWFLPYSNRFLM